MVVFVPRGKTYCMFRGSKFCLGSSLFVRRRTLFSPCGAPSIPKKTMGKSADRKMRQASASVIGLFGLKTAFFGAICVLGVSQGTLEAATQSKKLATFYTVESCKREGTSGVQTASGAPYDESALTCALPHRNFGRWYQVCSQEQPNRCVVVKHTDYGPGRKPRERGVVIDLTPAAFSALAPLDRGIIPVTVEEMK